MLLAPIRSFSVSISHQSDRCIRVCISHQTASFLLRSLVCSCMHSMPMYVYLMITSFYGLCHKVVISGVDRGISTAYCQSSSSDEYGYDYLVFQHCTLRISIIFLSALRCRKASFLKGSYLFLISDT